MSDYKVAKPWSNAHCLLEGGASWTARDRQQFIPRMIYCSVSIRSVRGHHQTMRWSRKAPKKCRTSTMLLPSAWGHTCSSLEKRSFWSRLHLQPARRKARAGAIALYERDCTWYLERYGKATKANPAQHRPPQTILRSFRLSRWFEPYPHVINSIMQEQRLTHS